MLLTCAATLALPLGLEGQGYRRYGTRVRLGDGLPDRPGGFTFCRLAFVEVRREPGGSSWGHRLPNAERNLTTRLSQLTPTPISEWEHGEPGFAIVRATDPELFQCPFLFASHVGVTGFEGGGSRSAQRILQEGRIPLGRRFWGNAAWTQWERQMELVFPDRGDRGLADGAPALRHRL